jgi:hypothetical protein
MALREDVIAATEAIVAEAPAGLTGEEAVHSRPFRRTGVGMYCGRIRRPIEPGRRAGDGPRP